MGRSMSQKIDTPYKFPLKFDESKEAVLIKIMLIGFIIGQGLTVACTIQSNDCVQ